jgi:alpha-L-fucosidase 2
LRQPEEVGWLLALFFRDMATDRGPWSGGLYPNLFAAHPPFQIDANFGFVAAVAECLVQSHDGRITLLPALPEEFSAGRIVSLVARPGIHVDIEWESAARRPDDRLMSVRLAALGPSAHGTYTVCYGSGSVTVTLDGHPIRLDRASFPR